MGCSSSKQQEGAVVLPRFDPWVSADGGIKTPFGTIDGASPTTQVNDFKLTKSGGGTAPWDIITTDNKKTGYTAEQTSSITGTKGFDVLRNGKAVIRATMKKSGDMDEWELFRFGTPTFANQKRFQKVGKQDMYHWGHLSMHRGVDKNESIVKKCITGDGDAIAPVHLTFKGQWPLYETIIVNNNEKQIVVGRWEAEENVAEDKKREWEITMRIAKGCDFGLHVALAVATKRSRQKE